VKHKKLIYAILFTFVFPLAGFAQEDPWITSIKQRFLIHSQRAVQEKIYLHLDRPLYLVGESMWFKAYNVEGGSNSFIGMSKVAYFEVLDKENNAVAQTKFSLAEGKGHGSLIIPSTIASGIYKVRCYTNWMKNFSADYFFESTVSIVNPFVKFDANPDEKIAASYDAAFFPEGGYLVHGLQSKVGFRVVAQNGKGVAFKGAIINQNNDTIVRFEPRKFGIGYFMITPAAENTYKAVIRDAKGKAFVYPLGEVKQEGYVMNVRDSTDRLIKVTVTSKTEAAAASVFLVAHTRQNNVLVEKKTPGNNRVEFVINRDKLGEGISNITILNEKLKPLCERLYFKRPEKQLEIDGKVSKASFETREKVTMDLSAKDTKGLAGLSNLSVAVYLEDSIKNTEPQDIASYLWLSSDLRGTVESPEYYFQQDTQEAKEDIDNLMLTHGWRRFQWNEVFANKAGGYPNLVEYDGHFVYGKVINTKTGAPAAGIESYLAALDFPARLYATRSDPDGSVRFELRNFFGPKEITIQTNLSQDSIYKFEMASPFSKQFAVRPAGSFWFDKTKEKQLLTRAINMQTSNAFLPKEFVQGKVVITDSTAFFGPPDEKYFLDDFTRFPTLEEVLREYVRGVLVRRRQKEFHFRMIDKLVPATFYTTDPLTLLDGIPIFNIDKLMEIDPLKIKKIETINGRYFLGPLSFTGLVSMSTYQNDLGGFELSPKVLVMPYEGVQAPREFYEPKYDTKAELSSRLPDFRNLLHWSPDVTTDASGKAQIRFNTSDQTGTYRVVVQGMTASGRAGRKIFTFEVAKRSL
jgi:hypothetical protein